MKLLKDMMSSLFQCHELTDNNIGDDNGEYYHKKAACAIKMVSKIGCLSMTIHSGKNNRPSTRDEFTEGNKNI